MFLAPNFANALPIIDYDAFTEGDNKAVLELNSGLIWMDFGVNHMLTFEQVENKLGLEYSNWRLPTEQEVIHLWTNLFGGLDGWTKSARDPKHYFLNTLPEQIDYINEISDIFIQYTHINNYLEGRYQTATGLTTALISEDAIYSSTGEFNSDDIPLYEISTLLVRIERVKVVEPSQGLLMLIGLGLLFFIRKRIKFH
jgi:hypothetical protein